MAAILAGHIMGMTMEEISKGLMDFVATENRQDIIKTDRFVLINDVYNASPDSMIAALKVLKLYKDNRRGGYTWRLSRDGTVRRRGS